MRSLRYDDLSLRGFTLVEVMLASTVFLFAVSATLVGTGALDRVRRDANEFANAAFLAQVFQDYLQSYGSNICSGNHGTDPLELLGDSTPGTANSDELRCFGTGVPVPFNCMPDYPRVPALNGVVDTVRVMEQAFDGAAVSPVWRVIDDGSPIPALRFRGENYRVVWNVDCGVPIGSNSKVVRIMVSWADYSYIERVEFNKMPGT